MQIEKDGAQITGMLREIANGRKIDYLNAHGTGTVANDEVEARAIQIVFGDAVQQPQISSTKAQLGHTFGASGAIKAAAAALSVKHDMVHGTITSDIIDNLNVPLHTVEYKVNAAVSSSYGFGGHNAALLMGKWGR